MKKDTAEYIRYAKTVLKPMREDAGLSQMEMANALDVSFQTISAWETGRSCPDAVQAWGWFNACGRSHVPYLLDFRYPDRHKTADMKPIMATIAMMPNEDRERLMYSMSNRHGSYRPGIANMLSAYLRLPLRARIGIVTLIVSTYRLCKRRGSLINPDCIEPDLKMLDKCIAEMEDAAANGRDWYTIDKD